VYLLFFAIIKNNGKKCSLQNMTNASFHSQKQKMAKNSKTDSK
jgi:hypothetical protein